MQGNEHGAHNLYFESAAVVVALVLLGKYLEENSKNSAKQAINSLVSMIPNTAIILNKEGEEVEIPPKMSGSKTPSSSSPAPASQSMEPSCPARPRWMSRC